jgi:ABC-type transport system substrate-binding protein
MNPYKGLDSGALWGFTVFDHLWGTPRSTGAPVLMLAKSKEQPDGTHITFTIPGDVTFHDIAPVSGRVLKASDIKMSFETAAKQTTISQTAWWTSVFDHCEAPDDTTLTIVLKRPDAWTFSSVNGATAINSSIIPAELLGDINQMDNIVIGSGRYQYVSSDGHSTNFKMQRFDKWRIKGEPWLAGLQYKLIQEQAAADAAFTAGQIDSLATVNQLETQQLEQQLGNKINTIEEQTTSIWTLVTRADGQFADPRVRQAISQGLVRKQFADLMYQGAAIPQGPVPSAFKSYALSNEQLAQTWNKEDIADAKAKLSAAGFDLTHEYELKYYTPGDAPAQFAQIVQKQLGDNLGIKIKLTGEDFGTWLANSLYGGNFDGFISFPSIQYDDPETYITQWSDPNAGRPNWAHFHDDTINDLITKQGTTLDDDAREKLFIELQMTGWDHGVPYIDVVSPTSHTCLWSYLKNVPSNDGLWDNYSGTVYIDKS